MGSERRFAAERRGVDFLRRAAAVLAVAWGVVTGPGTAGAQSYVCNDLASKLASLERRPVAATPGDRWAAAIEEQKQAIGQNRTAQARCGDARDPRCAAIVERGRQMDANLVNLQRQHARMGGGGSSVAASSSAEQARIRALMAQMRCGEKPAPGAQPVTATFDGTRSRVTINGATPGAPGVTYRVARPGEPPPGVRSEQKREGSGLFGFLFGGSSAAGDPEPGEEEVIDPSTARMLSGSYRTLCVRTCDGYFFPISFNASQGRLKTDANVCKALCPAAETRLYYHSNPGQEAEQAVAADGTRDLLTRLPNAFRYRTEVVPDCTCGTPDPRLLPPGAGGLKGTRDARLLGEELPLPQRRPNPDDDPETAAVTLSGLVVEPVSPTPIEETVAEAAQTPASPQKVRVVGPKYFSDR
jgi:hypothetical protein